MTSSQNFWRQQRSARNVNPGVGRQEKSKFRASLKYPQNRSIASFSRLSLRQAKLGIGIEEWTSLETEAEDRRLESCTTDWSCTKGRASSHRLLFVEFKSRVELDSTFLDLTKTRFYSFEKSSRSRIPGSFSYATFFQILTTLCI
jgi:hypothetical protein